MQHHKYSFSDLNDMIPWEREIYLTLLLQWIEEEEERQKKEWEKKLIDLYGRDNNSDNKENTNDKKNEQDKK